MLGQYVESSLVLSYLLVGSMYIRESVMATWPQMCQAAGLAKRSCVWDYQCAWVLKAAFTVLHELIPQLGIGKNMTVLPWPRSLSRGPPVISIFQFP